MTFRALDKGVEDVETERTSNTFTFMMYSGDTLEIDIDNERENVRPFFVMSQGREWFSAEEADDEISLTMVKAEKLMVEYEAGKHWVLPDGTIREDLPTEITATYDGPAWTSQDSLSYYRAELEENPDYNESRYGIPRNILAPSVAAEGSFVGQDEIAEDIGDAAANVAGGFFDRFKWWILGGIVVIGIFIYINARGRSGASPVGGD